jgi:hypothetical protein
MIFINRADAIKRNLFQYFLGTACKRGHVAPRYTSNGTCIECSVINARDASERSRLLAGVHPGLIEVSVFVTPGCRERIMILADRLNRREGLKTTKGGARYGT